MSYEIQVGSKWDLKLPEGSHENDLDVTYDSVELGAASTFMSYSSEDGYLRITANTTTSDQADSYPIKLRLVDSDGEQSELLTITLKIIDKETEDEKQQ